jgi:hypothetical protein
MYAAQAIKISNWKIKKSFILHILTFSGTGSHLQHFNRTISEEKIIFKH